MTSRIDKMPPDMDPEVLFRAGKPPKKKASPKLKQPMKHGARSYRNEHCAHDRIYNVAVWFLINYPVLFGNAVSQRRIRREIRESLGLPANLAWQLTGDFATHSRACGQHALNLGWVWYPHHSGTDPLRGTKGLEMTEANLNKVMVFLKWSDRVEGETKEVWSL